METKNNTVEAQVKKRNGNLVSFNQENIRNAIYNANREVEVKDRASNELIEEIVELVLDAAIKKKESSNRYIKIEEIQDIIEQNLVKNDKYNLVKKYIIYRFKRELGRKQNSTDNGILELIDEKNKDLQEENSNKDAGTASTQRDLIAGEVSKDLGKRILLPEEITRAHEKGEIHFHDLDYFLQHIFNCCLINIEDMLDNGTVMNNKLVESPKSFQVACTIMTQIIAAVASNQYGGQSVNIKYLGKYLRLTRDKYKKQMTEKFGDRVSEDVLEDIVNDKVQKELESGVQTIQYQVNTLMTTNGQSPFVTLFLHIDEEYEYAEESARIIEEILKQRIQGIKNEKGVYITPAFPKLVYVLDECNNLTGGKYDYITKLAAECSSKRMYPDYISAKKMREHYEGNVFSPMGCRSFLSPWKDNKGNYKFEGRFNIGVVSINLPQIGILNKGDEAGFFKLLQKRLELAKRGLMCRYERLLGTKSNLSPIHWQYGAIARLKKGETIDKLLKGGYATISIGYIGIYEATKLIIGESHTTPEGEAFAMKVMEYMKDFCDKAKEESGIGFGLYGTPAESLCYRFARIDKDTFGVIEDITDKGYYTNSYHVDVRENIDAFEKFIFESKFQKISSGGAISYIEIPDMKNNLEGIESLIRFIYDNIQYAEFNTKCDFCNECMYDGEMQINDNGDWYCPECGNDDKKKLVVTRRTCGYLGENFWNVGKTKEIGSRILHV